MSPFCFGGALADISSSADEVRPIAASNRSGVLDRSFIVNLVLTESTAKDKPKFTEQFVRREPTPDTVSFREGPRSSKECQVRMRRYLERSLAPRDFGIWFLKSSFAHFMSGSCERVTPAKLPLVISAQARRESFGSADHCEVDPRVDRI